LATVAISIPTYGFLQSGKADEFIETEITQGKIIGIRKDDVNISKAFLMVANFPMKGGFGVRPLWKSGLASVMRWNLVGLFTFII